MATLKEEQKKKERMEVRITPSRKEIIAKAVRYSGSTSASAFMIEAAVAKAMAVIEHQERILTTERDKEVFFHALFESDAKPNEALIALAEEYNNAQKK